MRCFWTGRPTGITLQLLTEDLDGGEVLGRSVIATRRHSWRRNRLAALAKSPGLLTMALSRLVREGATAPGAPQSLDWSGYSGPLYRMPVNQEVLTPLPRLALRRRGRQAEWSRGWKWSLGWFRSSEGDVPNGVIHRYQELAPPSDRYWADPFPMHTAGRDWVFFEQMVEGST